MRPTTILLVEDNPDDAELVRIAMADAGVTADLDVVVDGSQALDYVHARGAFADRPRPDLVLLDLNLPGIDGRAVLRDIKSDPQLCSIPIVVMSTSVDDEDVRSSYRMHANAFVSKAPDFDQLVATFQAIHAFWFTVSRLPTR